MSRFGLAKPSPSSVQTASQSGLLSPDKFSAITDPYLKWTVDLAPLLILSLFVLDFTFTQMFFFDGFTITDPMLSSGLLAAALALVLLRMTVAMIPWTLSTLWDRNIVSLPMGVKPGEDLQTRYERYVAGFERWMNSRYSWVCGAFFGGLIGFSFVYRGLSLNWLIGVLVHPTTEGLLDLLGVAFQTLIAYVIGLLVWRMVIVTVQIHQLGRLFDFNVQVVHPDRCGGLRPLGNLCLMNALTVSVGGIYLAGWVLAIDQQMDVASQYGRWEPFFLRLLLIISALAWVAFFDPLLIIHSEMQKSATRIRSGLDGLSRRMDELNRELCAKAEGMSEKERQEVLTNLQSLRETYERNSRIPVWPFDTTLSLKFLSSQALPILSLTGIGTETLDVIKGLLGMV